MRMAKSIGLSAFSFIAAAAVAGTGNPFSKPTATPSPASAQPSCEQIASMPNSPMSLETCKSMMALQQASNNIDPSAVHSGDDQMSCVDINAEMSTMRGVGLSQATRTESSQAAADYQAKLKQQQKEINTTGAAQTAAIRTAEVADAVVEKASGGVARTGAASKMEQGFQAQDWARGQQLAEERKPQETRLVNAGGTVAQDMTKSIQSNPRFGRLIQLAIAKKCTSRTMTP
jgi:hypothetical protein